MKVKVAFLYIILFFQCLHASEKVIQLPQGPLKYTVDAGWLPAHLQDNKGSGSIFYVAYHVPSDKPRPVTFCFNGGPGSSSVWLHMGSFGPKRVDIPGIDTPPIPSTLINNVYSLLPVTDLVFVDSIYTGFSRPDPKTQASLFFNYKEDSYTLAGFIHTYINKNNLFLRPLYLLGSSYGTLRVVGVAENLSSHYQTSVSGLIMISALLNFQSLVNTNGGNEIIYPLLVPTFAASSWYYNLGNARSKSLIEWIEEAKVWSSTEYLDGLMQGELLPDKQKKDIARKLSSYTGIKEDVVLDEDLRIDLGFYLKELKRDQERTIGRFDIRYNGLDNDLNRHSWFEYDPSYIVFGVIAAGFQAYLKQELNFEAPHLLEYYFLGKTGAWKYVDQGAHYISLNKTLRQLFLAQPALRLFVGSGIFDLATPFRVVEYDLAHLGLPESFEKQRITHRLYKGGHMLYTHEETLKPLSDDIKSFFAQPAIPTSSFLIED